jgi:hypothetical protein
MCEQLSEPPQVVGVGCLQLDVDDRGEDRPKLTARDRGDCLPGCQRRAGGQGELDQSWQELRGIAGEGAEILKRCCDLPGLPVQRGPQHGRAVLRVLIELSLAPAVFLLGIHQRGP